MERPLYAKKSLGQNFLKSRKAIHQMIDAAGTKSNDLIIEIGPGKGALTKPILETGARVIAFELDERMIDYLNTELSNYVQSGQLLIIHRDVLDIDMDEFFGKKGNYKVIANIPYYITNAIIRKFLETQYQPTDMSLLMQREVAERIVVRDGKESILSLSVSVFGEARYIGKVDRKYFSPSPKVHSAIVHIGDISHERLALNNQDLFFEIIKTAFSQKRKKCIKNLEKIADKKIWQDIFSELEIDDNTRAEQINIDTWLQILDIYIKNK